MGKMADTPVKIDLNEFKLHLYLNPETGLTLHFDTPSRKFYLAVIALVIHAMKHKNTITSIPLHHHMDELVLFNKTIGKEAGSSKKELLLNRIYRKWKDALPDLENAPLFKIIGRKKRYDDFMDKVYVFSEAEKDGWANLFEYMGSHENVRLKFSLDKLSLGLEDAAVVYGDSSEPSEDAWQRFIADLKQRLDLSSGTDGAKVKNSEPESRPMDKGSKQSAPGRRKQMIPWVIIGFIVIIAGFLFWQYNKPVSSVEKASVDKMAFPLPEKPSIAVLPFDNMSGDPSQEFFSDGITESIIATLSKIEHLFVIARTSSFTYKNKPVKVQKIAEDLGVRYVLEGSVQKTEDRVRVTAQLIDAVAGHHLWSERYDRDLKDILDFELQDEIVMKIGVALQLEIERGEEYRFLETEFTDFNVYLKFLEAASEAVKFTKEANNRFGKLAREIVDMAPESEVGYRMLGWYHWHLAYRGLFRENIEKAFAYTQKALSINEDSALTYGLLCVLYSTTRQHEKAIAAGKRAIEMQPNGSRIYGFLGNALCFAEQYDQGIFYTKKGIRLDPAPHANYFQTLALCYFGDGQYEQALIEIKKAVKLMPERSSNHKMMAIVYVLLDQQEKSQASAKKALALDQKKSISRTKKTWPFKTKNNLPKVIDAMRKAGFPE